MGDFTVVDDGHGLEAPVRVGADAAAAGGGRELVRAGMVQQQKRAEGAAMVAVAEQRAHREAIAHPVGTGAVVYTQNLLQHGALSLVGTAAAWGCQWCVEHG